MKTKHLSTLLYVLGLSAFAATGLADDSIISFTQPDASNIEELTLLTRVKEIGIAALSYVIGPLMGTFVAFKGWQMIGNSPRGDKGPGILVFVCGIGMFALPKIITEVLKAIGQA